MALPWSQDDWLEDVTSWIDASVERAGPLVDLHRRVWSAMLLVPLRGGTAYFKATAPALTHEAALTEALTLRAPAHTVELLEVDASRGWLLMRDSGETLRTLAPGLDRYERLLARYAELQLQLAAIREPLLALGVPDRRLARMSELAAQLDVDPGLVADVVAAIRLHQLPDTLIHEEVHDGNVLVRDGVEVFIDWSDSSVGHPFFGIVVALRSAADRLRLEPGAPELERLLDAYLEPWTALAPRTGLRTLFPAAYRLGMLNRALSWQAIVAPLEGASRAEHQQFVSAWVKEFLQTEAPRPGT
jgi:hypothetical protein